MTQRPEPRTNRRPSCPGGRPLSPRPTSTLPSMVIPHPTASAAGDGLANDEAEVVRHIRFGELPAPIRQDELVEVVDVNTPAEVPLQAFDAREWGEGGR